MAFFSILCLYDNIQTHVPPKKTASFFIAPHQLSSNYMQCVPKRQWRWSVERWVWRMWRSWFPSFAPWTWPRMSMKCWCLGPSGGGWYPWDWITCCAGLPFCILAVRVSGSRPNVNCNGIGLSFSITLLVLTSHWKIQDIAQIDDLLKHSWIIYLIYFISSIKSMISMNHLLIMDFSG